MRREKQAMRGKEDDDDADEKMRSIWRHLWWTTIHCSLFVSLGELYLKWRKPFLSRRNRKLSSPQDKFYYSTFSTLITAEPQQKKKKRKEKSFPMSNCNCLAVDAHLFCNSGDTLEMRKKKKRKTRREKERRSQKCLVAFLSRTVRISFSFFFFD